MSEMYVPWLVVPLVVVSLTTMLALGLGNLIMAVMRLVICARLLRDLITRGHQSRS
jgi:hypothetical protein